MADENITVTEQTITEQSTENTAAADVTQEPVQETAAVENTSENPPAEDTPTQDIDIDNVNKDDPKEVSEALNKKGIDYNALSEEYIKTGKLSDKSMSDLAAAGIPAEMVDTYIKGYEARAELERNELAECVGGRAAMEDVITWASKNLAKDEIITLNAIRNKFELQAVLIGLKTRMEQQEGKTPDYQKGTGDKTTTAGFRSQAEMFEAIKDPRYNKDEAYRSDVQKKIAASREAGINLGIY